MPLELTVPTAAGMAIGVLISSQVIDYWVKLKSATNQMTPEQRLPLMIIGGVLLPAGLFIFGVSSSPKENAWPGQSKRRITSSCPTNPRRSAHTSQHAVVIKARLTCA